MRMPAAASGYRDDTLRVRPWIQPMVVLAQASTVGPVGLDRQPVGPSHLLYWTTSPRATSGIRTPSRVLRLCTSFLSRLIPERTFVRSLLFFLCDRAARYSKKQKPVKRFFYPQQRLPDNH